MTWLEIEGFAIKRDMLSNTSESHFVNNGIT